MNESDNRTDMLQLLQEFLAPIYGCHTIVYTKLCYNKSTMIITVSSTKYIYYKVSFNKSQFYRCREQLDPGVPTLLRKSQKMLNLNLD